MWAVVIKAGHGFLRSPSLTGGGRAGRRGGRWLCPSASAAGSAVAARVPGPAGAPLRRRSARGSLPATLVRRARRGGPRLRSTWRRLRLQLKRAALCLLALSGALLSRSTVRAEDRVTIRGAYYREPSTRVIQPVVEITKDLPHGFDINAHYLVDTITSASAAAGTSVDSIFTEIRSEVGLGVGKTWDRTRATLSYKYSAESDYWSHAFWASLSRHLLGQHGDGRRLRRIQPGLGRIPHAERRPVCAGRRMFPARSTRCSAASGTRRSCRRWPSRRSISTPPTSTASWPTPTARWRASGTRSFPTSASGPRSPSGRAYYFPQVETGLQVQYRYYRDFYPGALPPA